MMTRANPVVVCATDFSPEAESALRWATALAGRERAELDLVHVVPPPSRSLDALATDVATFEADHLADVSRRLTGLLSSVSAAGLTVNAHVLVGEAHTEIVAHAQRSGARMIVLGACGRPVLERWLLGSVAERTIRAARCPVAVVPREPPDRVWFPDRTLKALVALEGNEGHDVIAFTGELRRRTPCDVTFLHLYWPPEEYERLGLRGARNMAEPDPDVVRDLEPKLRTQIGVLPGRGHLSVRIQPAWGSPAANIRLAVERADCDVLVVGAHQRHGLARVLSGSVAEQLARRPGAVPLVCVPASPTDREQPRKPVLPRFLTVLAPTDLSAVGNAAVPHAYALLRATGGVVELLHVHEHGIPNPAYAYEPPGQLSPAERAKLERDLWALIPAEADALGITTHVSVVDGGKAGEAILQAAERLAADAISIGSHGRGGVARAVMGSVADDVVRRARRPVLVVR
jgi:nucleotide-binding universal stress UspA family protein